jgi:hypothetical protein
MKNKKIWLVVACIFLALCVSLALNLVRDNSETEDSSTELSQKESDVGVKQTEEIEVVQPSEDTQQTDGTQETEAIKSTQELDSIENMANNNVDSDLNNSDEKNIASQVESSSIVHGYTETNPDVALDQYKTEPVPEGEPLPVEWDDMKIEKDKELKCTLSVDCSNVLNNLDNLNEDKKEIIPEEGVIYTKQEVTFYEGETVFNVLLREMKKNKIHMEYVMTQLYNSNFIEGIGNLYELDCGELSGWIYKVNGWSPNYGCSRYKLKDGDVIEWQYTCDLGRDVDSEFMNKDTGE